MFVWTEKQNETKQNEKKKQKTYTLNENQMENSPGSSVQN